MIEEIKSTKITGNCRLATKHAWLRSEQFIGQIVEVLVEKISKKSTEEFSGETHKALPVFPKKIIKLVTL
jgi:tRNA-2-methylthio-N6-dimethylallyladenosine synthase